METDSITHLCHFQAGIGKKPVLLFENVSNRTSPLLDRKQTRLQSINSPGYFLPVFFQKSSPVWHIASYSQQHRRLGYRVFSPKEPKPQTHPLHHKIPGFGYSRSSPPSS